MKKRITIILLLLNSIIAISQETKYINANELNIRNGAGKNFEIVTKATKNEKVTVISENGNWTEIETENGVKGFVSTNFLSNSIKDNSDKKIGDYPVISISVGIILVLLIFRVKKFLNNIFKFSSNKSTSNRSVAKKVFKTPKQVKIKENLISSVEKEKTEVAKVQCKYCGSQYGSIKQMVINNCSKSPNRKHQLYEGSIKSKYQCKDCGSKYNTIAQMVINNCKKNSTGRHQPAL